MLNNYLINYIDGLLKSKRKSTNKKGRSALEFYFYLNNNAHFSSYRWSKKWNVSTSTSYEWCKEFEAKYRNAVQV